MSIPTVLVTVIFYSTLLFSSEEAVNPLIQKFDKNDDGKIFYEEASAELQEHFCQYDVDQDAYLNDEELKVVPLSFAKEKTEKEDTEKKEEKK